MSDIKFKIVVPMYNAEKWIKLCLRSIKLQDYKNFDCIIVNDSSTDNSKKIIEDEIKDLKNFKLLNTDKNGGALASLFYGIENAFCEKEDVIVVLDGDDWFYNKETLTILNKNYLEKKCWMSYGSYVEYPSLVRGNFSRQVPEQIIKNNLFRESTWMTSHLRSFKYKLWKKIDKEDLLDKNNQFYPMAGDLAAMFPLLEMAGNRALFIEDILYVYNRANVLNEDKVNHSFQLSMESEIRNRKKYNKIDGDL